MLMLTRKPGETVIAILDERDASRRVVFKVLGVRGGQVRIGVDAPDDVKLYRDELLRRIEGEPQR